MPIHATTPPACLFGGLSSARWRGYTVGPEQRRLGAHEAELKTMARVFADVKMTDEVVALLAGNMNRTT